MEEKILFREKTHKFLPYIKIAFIIVIIALVAYFVKELYDYSHYFDNHIHDSSCVGVVNESDDLLYTEKDYETKRDEYSTFSEYIAGEYEKNRHKYTITISARETNHTVNTPCLVLGQSSISGANSFFFGAHLGDLIFQGIILGSIILVLHILLNIFTYKKCNYIVTDNTIRGKKGYKKFDIPFSDIKRITQKGKLITIEIENKKLNLSSIEKCNEIYNYIKQFVFEEPVINQEANNVNSIKNILD